MDNDLSTKLSEATREIERLKEIIFQMDGILSIHGVVYKDISPERVKELPYVILIYMVDLNWQRKPPNGY